MLCLEKNDVIFNGYTKSSDIFSHIDIELVQCDSTKRACPSQANMDTYFDDMELKVLFSNRNFNFKDFFNNINYLTDD